MKITFIFCDKFCLNSSTKLIDFNSWIWLDDLSKIFRIHTACVCVQSHPMPWLTHRTFQFVLSSLFAFRRMWFDAILIWNMLTIIQNYYSHWWQITLGMIIAISVFEPLKDEHYKYLWYVAYRFIAFTLKQIIKTQKLRYFVYFVTTESIVCRWLQI